MSDGLTVKQVRKALAAACEAAGSQRSFARMHGLPSGRVSEVLSGIRPPPTAICQALGIKRAVKYSWKKAPR